VQCLLYYCEGAQRRQEILMQTYQLVMIALIETTLFVGLSAALYAALPSTVFGYASRHGRYVGLGKPDLPDDSTAGNSPVTAPAGLQGQAA
jgi:hypothetical protein